METKKDLLERYEFIKSIHDISKEEYLIFTKDFKSKNFKKGEHIIEPGQVENQIFFSRSGVQMYYFDTQHKTKILGFVSPPNICAIPESFFFQKPAKYYLTCLTDIKLDYLTFDGLQKLFDKSQQIERLFRKLAESVIVGLVDRQIELRSTSIEERFKAFCQRSPHLLQQVPHKFIASYLSIDLTNFSKLYNKIRF